MFQVLNSNQENYNTIFGIAGLIIILESFLKCILYNISLEFIYNIFNNVILNILLCLSYHFVKFSAFLELYSYLFIFTNFYKIMRFIDVVESTINIFLVYYYEEYNYILFLSQIGYIFYYVRELKKYSGLIEEEYYIYHQLYLFLFRFIPLCYLLFEGKIYCLIYLILITFKILNI